jgi:hypothetical protein
MLCLVLCPVSLHGSYSFPFSLSDGAPCGDARESIRYLFSALLLLNFSDLRPHLSSSLVLLNSAWLLSLQLPNAIV